METNNHNNHNVNFFRDPTDNNYILDSVGIQSVEHDARLLRGLNKY